MATQIFYVHFSASKDGERSQGMIAFFSDPKEAVRTLGKSMRVPEITSRICGVIDFVLTRPEELTSNEPLEYDLPCQTVRVLYRQPRSIQESFSPTVIGAMRQLGIDPRQVLDEEAIRDIWLISGEIPEALLIDADGAPRIIRGRTIASIGGLAKVNQKAEEIFRNIKEPATTGSSK